VSIFDDVFYMGVGAVSQLKKNTQELVKKGKITQEEAQRMFEDVREGEELKEQLSPLSLSLGFSMYMKKRFTDFLEDLQKTGKITTEEAKSYYQKYIPEDLQKKMNEEKQKNDYVTREEYNKILEKLEKINESLDKEAGE